MGCHVLLDHTCVCVCVVEDKPEEITISNNIQTLPHYLWIQRKTLEFKEHRLLPTPSGTRPYGRIAYITTTSSLVCFLFSRITKFSFDFTSKSPNLSRLDTLEALEVVTNTRWIQLFFMNRLLDSACQKLDLLQWSICLPIFSSSQKQRHSPQGKTGKSSSPVTQQQAWVPILQAKREDTELKIELFHVETISNDDAHRKFFGSLFLFFFYSNKEALKPTFR